MATKKARQYLMQSLARRGWPTELTAELLSRCGATEDDLVVLAVCGYVDVRDERLRLTRAGRRELARMKRRRDF